MEDQSSVLTKGRDSPLHNDRVYIEAFPGCSEDGMRISFNAEALVYFNFACMAPPHLPFLYQTFIHFSILEYMIVYFYISLRIFVC